VAGNRPVGYGPGVTGGMIGAGRLMAWVPYLACV
jgi:hypothetical protein